jgi:hypothetical protein
MPWVTGTVTLTLYGMRPQVGVNEPDPEALA